MVPQISVKQGLTVDWKSVKSLHRLTMPQKQLPAPRSLQEWMERTGTNAESLLELVRRDTGHSISRTMLSFILRGSRPCSRMNAIHLHAVTGVPIKALCEWPKVSGVTHFSGKRPSRVA